MIEVGKAILDANTIIPEKVHFVIVDGIIQKVDRGNFRPSEDVPHVDQWIRKPNRIAIPGLINTHGHAAMTLLRGAGDDMPLMDWLNDRIFPLEDKLTEDAIYWGTLLATWEMLASGTTTYTDMYMMMDNAARAVAESGMRGVLSVGMVGMDETSRENGRQRSRAFKSWHNTYDGRITVTLGPHAPYTCNEKFLAEVGELAAELGLPIQIHISETRGELDNSLRDHALTPVEFVARSGLFSVPTLAAHCVHVNDHDMDVMKEYGVHIAHNPQSNLKLGSGIAPLPSMLSKGLVVGLGTDGAASNNNLDMFEEMRLAATLHKGVHEDAECIDAATAFHLATAGGANACFLANGHGVLAHGSPADIVLLDADAPHFLPEHNLLSDVVYAAGADDVREVFVNGVSVFSNGAPTGIDTERVRYEVNQIKTLLSQA